MDLVDHCLMCATSLPFFPSIQGGSLTNASPVGVCPQKSNWVANWEGCKQFILQCQCLGAPNSNGSSSSSSYEDGNLWHILMRSSWMPLPPSIGHEPCSAPVAVFWGGAGWNRPTKTSAESAGHPCSMLRWDSGAIVLTCPICPSSVDSHATVLRGPRWAGVGAACPAMPSMAQQLEGGGWFWFFDYGAKGHQGAPRGTWSPKLSKSCDSGDLRKAPSWSSTCKKNQKAAETKNLQLADEN